jgi:hypothetical protein
MQPLERPPIERDRQRPCIDHARRVDLGAESFAHLYLRRPDGWRIVERRFKATFLREAAE